MEEGHLVRTRLTPRLALQLTRESFFKYVVGIRNNETSLDATSPFTTTVMLSLDTYSSTTHRDEFGLKLPSFCTGG
ncbi:hypothetical protein BCON_0253g00080 [Botryotinia convoluta]|uniref:Uncharacterized protein n=1 Tax=Botryotinia convoluta TaxID=54673 RepID=A0A4Z1HG78_9HELO|nr:hypothetical protein BCON_0253g00080 [Botryotinia convoluta]